MHVGISPARIEVAHHSTWKRGGFNLVVPMLIKNKSSENAGTDKQEPGQDPDQDSDQVLLRVPMPAMVGDAQHPGSVTDKLRCETASYIWMQRHSPEARIPHLYAVGFPDWFFIERLFIVSTLNQILYGLNFLHEVAGVIHTDLHAGNLLIALPDTSVLSELEEDEMEKPTLRKIVDDTTVIHNSKNMLKGMGPLTICDFGQARIGPQHTGIAMPVPYRAPEVILKMPWGKAIDMWSTWEMLERKPLFDVYDAESPEKNDVLHLATMTAVLGRPPRAFLALSDETKKYWDGDGNWIGPVPLPDLPYISKQITSIKAEDKTLFLSFIGNLISWNPNRRMDSGTAYQDDWLDEYRKAVARQEQARS
ncbi:hypothetical protein SCUCBS95973_007326 [Sporothrix curviconia]|uniref:Protein kinase domain-containing protein n=1 Tax=Sporothrix curviconia TaxID=1260050 RepID=A0ABP0CD43_9PEZI